MEYRPEMQFPDMPIPDAKGARRAASFCAFAAVAETAIAYLFIIAFSFLTRDAAFDSDTYNDLLLIVNAVAVDLIAMPLCWLLLLRRVPKNLSPEIGARTPLSMKKLLFFLPCAFVLMYAGSLTGKLIDLLFKGGLSDVVFDTMSEVDPWTTLLCAVIVGPIAEELFFRKAMIDRLSAYHPMDAILFSALLFGLIHGNLIQFLYAFPLGVLFGIIYYRTQNIGYTILLHVAVNTVGGLLPVLVQRLETAGETNEGMAMLGTLATMLIGSLTAGLVVVGVIFLIRGRRQFLPIESDVPRFRRPFYINAGFIVACIVFTGLFVLAEILG